MFIFKMMALKNILVYLSVISYMTASIILFLPGVLIWSSEIFLSAGNMIGCFLWSICLLQEVKLLIRNDLGWHY